MAGIASRSCLSIEEIAGYVGGQLTDRDGLERHVEACDDCRRAVAAAIRAARIPEDPGPTIPIPPPTALPRGELLHAPELTVATLRDEEIRSARTMILQGRWIGLAAILPIPWLGGVLAVQIAFAALVVCAIGVGVAIERRITDPDRYDERSMVILAVVVSAATMSGMLYYGIFSAAQLYPVLMLYAFSRRERFGTTLAIYVLTAGLQLVMAVVVLAELAPDPGLFEPQTSSRVSLAVGHLLIQIGDAGALFVGWASRRDTRAAIDNLQKAMLLAARREVLLQEVRDDLDRAIRVGAAGRYTDHQFGAYRLGCVLGRGGMGEVYEASHVDSGEPAAVKLLPPAELGNPRAVERFVREVRAISGLRSRHVVRVLGASAATDPIPYLVMERLHGQTLAQLLRASPSPQRLVDMLGQVGTALEEAWAQGIVHRDLKPHNLFLAELPDGPTWKVLDFGVASLAEHGGTLTEGHIIGTPAYMAPEQARGERVDARVDVYALSAIAYRWLTGRPSCSGELRAALYQVVNVMPTRPSALADLDPDVDAVLAIGLAKDPAARWTRVSELRDALAAALEGTLDPALRQRAAELIARQPWGSARPPESGPRLAPG